LSRVIISMTLSLKSFEYPITLLFYIFSYLAIYPFFRVNHEKINGIKIIPMINNVDGFFGSSFIFPFILKVILGLEKSTYALF
ncbi:hypothetical protein, partial [Acinetobacter boissieri]|uniref:hypothetical protein n=1 Tax=Acinetobacter boissieri TaxID=1219383 RepID=UPI001BB468EE